MASVPCPHCKKPVPAGSRICFHCLKDIVVAPASAAAGVQETTVRERRVPQGESPPLAPAPAPGAGGRFVWLLRIVYGVYAFELVSEALDRLDRTGFFQPPAAWYFATALMPAVTLALIVVAMVRVRRDPFLWTVLLAALQSVEFVGNRLGPGDLLGSVWLTAALWAMAFAAPRLARTIEGRVRTRFDADDRKIVWQVAIVYVGTLLLLECDLVTSLWSLLAYYAGLAFIGFIATLVDAPYAMRETLRLHVTMRGFGLALLVTAFNLLITIWLLTVAAGDWIPDIPTLHSVRLNVFFVIGVLPAVFEELLCRGVLWQAVSQRTGEAGTILLTAALFALLHLGGFGADSGAIPYQFIGGLLLGWLRARTGSLVPCMICHAAFNTMLVAMV